ncbi:MAG: NF038122 family metalloprotease [Acidobacteria bacterium]|nr:NF038122 family metalloprotease [Acidobacteriota bacterium]
MRSTLFLTLLGCLLAAGLAGAVIRPASAAREALTGFGAQPVTAPQNYIPQIQELRAARPALAAETQDHLHGTPLEGGSVLELRDGQMYCRAATEEEARAIRSDHNQQLRVISDEALTPSSTEQAQKGLKIILRGTPQLEQFPQARAAFLRAAAVWESLIQNPITVVIDVDFGPTFFGEPFEEYQLAQTRFQQRIHLNAYSTIRSALIRSAGSPQEAALYNALPPAQLPTDLGAATAMVYHIPAMRALGFFPPVPDPDGERETLGLPPAIVFNSAESYDFDPSDGIKPKKSDFTALAMHEIGHVLGFSSSVGIKDLSDYPPAPEPLDLFRFRPGVTFESFSSAPRILSQGGEHIFFGSGPELPLSTARLDGTGGDGRQAGHWKDGIFTGRYIGIMEANRAAGYRYEITDNDLRAFELIGYRTNPLPNPREAELKVDDGTIDDGDGNNGWIVINRVTPSSYPATLRKLRILIPVFKGQPDPAGKPITLYYAHSNPGARFNRIETTVPSASNDLFLEFTLPNDLTINSGDFYVGYQAPSPHQGVGFAADLSGTAENRSFYSVDNGASFAPFAQAFQGRAANAMIRAVISIPGPAPTPTPVPTPTPSPGPATVALASDVPHDGYMATWSQRGHSFETQYTIQVPSGARQLKIDLNANTDLDLYARFGSRVEFKISGIVADFKSVSDNYHESITITPASSPALQAGIYYLRIVNYGPGPSTFRITATVTGGQSCAYSLVPASLSFEAAGGSGSVYVLATRGCNWTASSNADWIALAEGNSGTGEGTVRYSVAANNSTGTRTGTLTIAGQTYTVTQAGKSAGGGVTEILSVDDGAPEGVLGGNGFIYVNRLTPAVYPATLQAVRIFFRKLDDYPSPAGAQIRLIAFAGSAGTERPPDNPPLLLDQTVTIPAIAPGGEFVDFPIANGPTINAGDLYVGFQLPNPSGGVGAFFDLNSTSQLRSFTSPDGGAFYVGPWPPQQPGITSVNLMVRAVVSVGAKTINTVVSVSAASYSENGLASEAIAAAFGTNLATRTEAALGELKTVLGGTRVLVKDSAGIERQSLLFFVSSGQVNYQIPPGTAAGPATVTVINGDGAVSVGTAQIAAFAPGLFSANGDANGVASASALRVKVDGSYRYEPVARIDQAQHRLVPSPIDLGEDLGAATDQVYLILYGTGLRQHQGLSTVSVKIGGVEAPVLYAGKQEWFVGLDQINVLLPRGLIGQGEVDVSLMVGGKTANKVKIKIL